MKKFIIKLIIIFISALVLGVTFLTVVYTIPTAKIRENVTTSAKTIQSEGMYPILFDWCTSSLDLYTDSIMLNTAAYDGQCRPIVEAMKGHRYYITNQSPNETLVDYYLNGVEYSFVDSYARYWHGYLVFLKPLLVFLNYSQIRVLNLILQAILLVILLIAMVHYGYKHLLFPFILSLLMVMPISLFMCMQYADCYYLFICASLLLLVSSSQNSSISKALIVFFLTGIATAFFDFFTFPQTTLGVPLIFFVSIYRDGNLISDLKKILLACLCWFSGYAFMWAGKWIVGTLITGESIFIRASEGIVENSKSVSVLEMLYGNIRDFLFTPFTIILFVYTLILIYRTVKHYKKDFFKFILPNLFICLFPFIWYCLLQQHSNAHHFFTNKELIVSSFSLLSGLSVFLNDKGAPPKNSI